MMKTKLARAALAFRIIFPWVLLLAGLPGTASLAATEEPTRNILLLFAFEHNVPGYIMAEKGLRQVLQADPAAKTVFFSEHMDLARFPEESYHESLVDKYRQKYAGKKIDLIIAMHVAALDFLNQHNDRLFSGVPVVFGIVPKGEIDKRQLGPNVTGVVDRLDMAGTLEMALKLLPRTRRVAVISGRDALDKALEDLVRQTYAPYRDRLEFTYLSGLPMPELLGEVAKLPMDTVVIYSSIFLDGAGKAFVPVEALRLLAPAANAPIFGAWDTFVGNGLVGGNVASVEQDGIEMGELALEILQDPAQRIPAIRPGKNVLMVDWRQMKRWGLSMDLLPAHSVIKYQEKDFWDLYKREAIGFIALVILESLLIGFLLAQRARRLRAEEGLRLANENLERRVQARTAQLENINQQLRLEMDERRQAEEALRQTQHFRQRVMETTPTLIYIYDLLENRNVYINSSITSVLGYTPEEVHRQGSRLFANILHPDDIPMVAEHHARLAEAGSREISEIEYRMRHADGHWVSLRSRDTVFAHDEQGVGKQILGSAEDITARKLAQDKLRQNEQVLRMMFEHAPLGIMHFDTRGVLVDCNHQFASIMGAPREQILGFNLLTQMNEGPARQALEETLRGGRGFFEGEYTSVSGRKPTYLRANHRLMHDDQGVAMGAVSLVEDFTERKALEKRLSQAGKMEAIGTLAGGIAHDFNNILAAIMGFAEMACEDARAGKANPSDIKQILASAQRAKELVQQILAFSRQKELDLKPIDLNRLVEGTRAILERTLPKMVAVETNLSADLPTVQGDPVQFEQVLLNLASNANDAMPEGGRLTFTTRAVALDQGYHEQHLEVVPGRYVLLEARDTGLGMDKSTLEHIFEPFYTTKELGKGTGLGLASVYGIVKSHGGYIYCHSEVGQGATFEIYLPVLQEGALEIAKGSDLLKEQALTGTETILLVDDEESLRKLGARNLERMGYRIVTASSGEEALQIYRAQGSGLDLVIMDLSMPGMGGHKAIRSILDLNPKAKVIIASGYSAKGQVKGSLESGVAGYVAKPFRRAELLSTVRSVLNSG